MGDWNDGSPVLGCLAQRQASGCNNLASLTDLYLTFKNNNSWQTSQRFATNLFNYGGGYLYQTISSFTGYYTAYDMYVHPIENLLHIIYIKEMSRTDSTPNSTMGIRREIRLMKVNRQGSVVSDVLIFDTVIGPPAGHQFPGGFYDAPAGFIDAFYKSTGDNFTPYFYVLTSPKGFYGTPGTSGPSYSNIFKYVNGAYTNIYQVANFSPYGSNSGNVGGQTIVFT